MQDIGKNIPYRFRGRNILHNERYIQIALKDDNETNTITFILDRYYKDIDLSEFEVQFLITGSFMPEPYADILTTELTKVVDRTSITLTWNITNQHTSKKGLGSGQFRFISVEEEIWSTDIFGLFVGESLVIDEVIEQLYPSILADHTARIQALERFHPENYYNKEETDGLLADKVDKEEGKGLTTNDLTNELKTAYDGAVDKKHEHSNKTVLDATTEPFTAVLKASYDDAVTAKHTHSNKSTLDSTNAAFTTTLKTNYDDANTKKHTHSNKAILDATTASYTTDEKSKLAALESSHFRGQYLSKTALDTTIPLGNEGDYAYVDAGIGFVVQKYLWDSSDNEWVPATGEGGEETPASIKYKYESNPDTNAFTDAEKTKLANTETADLKDNVTTFTESATRTNIATGEKTSTIFGKIKKWFTDLKPHAFNDLATVQGTQTNKAPTNKLLKESSFSRVYRALSELTGITTSSTVADVVNAMPIGAYLLANTSGYVNLVPTGQTDTNCVIEIKKVNDYRVTLGLSYQSSANTIAWASTYRPDSGFHGWKQLFTTDNISTVMPISSAAASNNKVLSEKVVYNEFALKAPLANPTFTGNPSAPTPTTAQGIANKEYVDNLIPYDKIIRTQPEFDALIGDEYWLDAESVALVGQFILSAPNGIKVPDTVKQIHGFKGAKITITNFVYNATTAKGGLWYNTAPTALDYSIRDLEVDCTGTGTIRVFMECTNLTNCTGTCTGTGGYYGYGFYNCNNITNCTGTSTGTGTGYGFYNCNNITNCTGTGTGTDTGYGFYNCNNITNCTGTGTGTSSGYGFIACTNLTNCTGTGTSYGFYNITTASNCRDGGSSTAMWGGTNKNIDLDTCCKTPVTADNTTLNT